jgi:hypothetical protein
MDNSSGNHIYATDDSETDNTCPDCGEFLDNKGECSNCCDTKYEDSKFDEKYYKEK